MIIKLCFVKKCDSVVSTFFEMPMGKVWSTSLSECWLCFNFVVVVAILIAWVFLHMIAEGIHIHSHVKLFFFPKFHHLVSTFLEMPMGKTWLMSLSNRGGCVLILLQYLRFVDIVVACVLLRMMANVIQIHSCTLTCTCYG